MSGLSRYIYRFMKQEELCAFYRDASVALVTPIRDGWLLFCVFANNNCDTFLKNETVVSLVVKSYVLAS